MTGTGNETLTAALRRLADEHASGLLAVATPDRDVVLELVDGVPVGIGPTADAGGRAGADAPTPVAAAAVVDELVDRTVAAIVGGGGAWTWDVDSDASLLPVPPGLATELSRRAVDAAQALAQLAPERVLTPGRQLEVHGEVARVLACFDGERTLEEVADAAGLTLPATAIHAAALVRAGVLATGMEDPSPRSWGDAVASAAEEDEDDEPELWVMEPPEPEPEPEPEPTAAEPAAEPEPDSLPRPGTASEPEAPATTTPERRWVAEQPAEQPADRHAEEPASSSPDPAAAAVPDPAHDAEPAGRAPSPAPAASDDWDDTSWLDDIDADTDDHQPPAAEPEQDHDGQNTRATLSAMLSDLQPRQDEGGRRTSSSPAPEPAPPPAPEESDRPTQRAAGVDQGKEQRREPRAEPGDVAEFLRELSRLALDED